jgi:serine/threonine-protein kinase
MTGVPVPPGDAPRRPGAAPSQPFAGAVPANTVLDSRYRLDGRIATGGMGEVWRGVDQTLGRPVAVKLLRPEYAGDESFLVRFRGEARHAARLSHPGVCSVYDYGEVQTADGHPTAYLVMELVEGEPLSAVLHREKKLSPDRMLDVLGQAADALQAAHALGVVHRDVKPGNLLLRHDGAVKVTDFGIARAVDAAPLTATGIMMGTAYYVSPEQASGRLVTPASDVYSLGVVAYECLAGRRPFDDRNPIVVVMAHQNDSPAPLPPDVPYKVRALVGSAMAKDPARRPASAGAFARSAAGIRRGLWSGPGGAHGAPDTTRWNGTAARPAASQLAGPDVTARHPGPAGIPGHSGGRAPSGGAGATPGGPPPGPAGPVGLPGRPGRVTSRNRAPSWVTQPGAVAPTTVSSYGRGDAVDEPAPPPWEHPDRAPQIPPPPTERGGRAEHRRRASADAPRRRLTLPVLLVLLLLTVAVTALITRALAGKDGSTHQGAAAVTRVVHSAADRDGIVNGDGPTRGGGATAGDWRD